VSIYSTLKLQGVGLQFLLCLILKGGKTGVFDIDDLVTVLKAENAKEICVIKIPPEIKLTDYMVIVSGISVRHLRAIVSSVNYIVSFLNSTSMNHCFIQ
jgi:hypothetical protein